MKRCTDCHDPGTGKDPFVILCPRHAAVEEMQHRLKAILRWWDDGSHSRTDIPIENAREMLTRLEVR